MGFKFYGFDAEAARIAHDISIAASHFQLNQLPELYTAFERHETNFLVQYIGTNVPQAWAGGSVFMLTQALLGLLPDAPRNKLYVDPPLPTWLPDLTVHGLRVGKRKFDICFWREQTSFEVATGNPKLVERCDLVSLGERPPHPRLSLSSSVIVTLLLSLALWAAVWAALTSLASALLG